MNNIILEFDDAQSLKPGLKLGPFIISLTASSFFNYDINLCTYGSNSYNHFKIDDSTLNLNLIPRFRFIDSEDNIVSSVPITEIDIVYDENSNPLYFTGSALFYYIDDMPSDNIIIEVELFNKASTEIGILTSLEYNVKDNVNFSIGSWIPQVIKFSSDGINEISHKWEKIPIRFYTTLHEVISDKLSPIIFHADASNLEINFPLITDNLNIIKFNKNTDGLGYCINKCVMHTDNELLSSISGNINYNDEILMGESNIFTIYPFKPLFEFRKFNESWNFTEQIKEYAMAPHINSMYNFWDNFIDSAVGGIDYGQQLGRIIYDKIANYVPYNIDIDESNIKQLYSISYYLDVPIDSFDLDYPYDINRIINMGSINHSRLWGEIVKCNLNITSDKVCKRCGYMHSNLGNKIISPQTYMLSVGYPIIKHDRFSVDDIAWELIIPTIKYYNINSNKFEDYIYSGKTDYNMCTSVSMTADQVTAYPLSTILEQDYNIIINKCSNYTFYEYKNQYPILNNCDPMQKNHPQAIGVINWTDNYTTFNRNLSSMEEWFGDEKMLELLIEYNLLKGLQVEYHG